MRNLDIADSRARLEQYVQLGQLTGGDTQQLIGELERGGHAGIPDARPSSDGEAALDRAAMEFGVD